MYWNLSTAFCDFLLAICLLQYPQRENSSPQTCILPAPEKEEEGNNNSIFCLLLPVFPWPSQATSSIEDAVYYLPALLWPDERTPGILCLVLCSPVQESQGSATRMTAGLPTPNSVILWSSIQNNSFGISRVNNCRLGYWCKSVIWWGTGNPSLAWRTQHTGEHTGENICPKQTTCCSQPQEARGFCSCSLSCCFSLRLTDA